MPKEKRGTSLAYLMTEHIKFLIVCNFIWTCYKNRENIIKRRLNLIQLSFTTLITLKSLSSSLFNVLQVYKITGHLFLLTEKTPYWTTARCLTPTGFETTYGFHRQTWLLTPAVAEKWTNVIQYIRRCLKKDKFKWKLHTIWTSIRTASHVITT